MVGGRDIQAKAGRESGHHITLAQFIQNLVSSSLMTEDQVQSVLDSHSGDQRPETADDLAKLLYRQGHLTRFQARAVYQGKTRGVVLGNYVVLDKLGRGGMGQVFKAQHRRMERVVALKMLPTAAMRSPDAVKRFQREAKAAAKLSHHNIVTAHDADEANGIHFLVMEYVEGQDLAALVKEQGPLSVATAVDYILQAAQGLDYAHRQGVVHRDIKPSNILLDSEGVIKVLDMGLARVDNATAGDDALTHTGQVMGTLDYMSTEQAFDTRNVDGRTDIYSLGCTLHYLLTGGPPYEGDTATKKILAHRQDPVPSLQASNSNVPETLESIFRQMLAKDPDQRQKSMAEVIQQLSQCPVSSEVGTSPHRRKPSTVSETQCLAEDSIAETTTSAGSNISLERSVATPEEARVKGPSVVSDAIQRLAHQDYAGVISLLAAVPSDQRSEEAAQLLKQARDLQTEVEQLNDRMNEAVRHQRYEGLRQEVLEHLLEIEPGNLQARDLYEHLGTYGPDEQLRFDQNGKLLPAHSKHWWVDRLAQQLYQRMNRRQPSARGRSVRRKGEPASATLSSSDLPVIPLAIGLGILGVAGLLMAIVFLFREGDQTIRVEIDPALVNDATVTVWMDDRQMEIAGLGETIKLKPGDHGYEIRRGDEIVTAREFTVLKGDNPALRISVEGPATHRTARLTEWENMKYGMFIHFGMGTFARGIAEKGHLPSNTYAPTNLDVRQWIRVARQVGMKYAVLTVKHHSGHCLWDSRDYDYDVATSGNATDVVAEFMAACQTEGIQPGLWYAIPDGHNEGGLVRFKGPPISDEYFRLVKQQITELHSRYQGIREQWLDGAGRLTPRQRSELYQLIKRLSPDCLVASTGMPPHDGGIQQECWPCDIITRIRASSTAVPHNPVQRFQGDDYYLPLAVSDKISNNWFYQSGDSLKSQSELETLWHDTVGLGANLLLNVPPDRSGRIPDEFIAALTAFKNTNDLFPPETRRGTPADEIISDTSRQQFEPGFVSLFDGRTLNGWEGDKTHYHVENGLLVSDFGDQLFRDKAGGNLLTSGEYGDFVLRLEFQLQPGGNSGVLIRSPSTGWLSRDGMEIQILDDNDPKFAQSIQARPHVRTGSISSIAAAQAGRLKPAGVWNDLEITCQGRHVTVRLNASSVVDIDLESLGGKGLDGQEHPGQARLRGHVGLFGYASCGRVEYRNIRIKELSLQDTSLMPETKRPEMDKAPSPAVAPLDAAAVQKHQRAWAQYLGVPVETTNSIGMRLTLIPPGEYMRGSTTEEIEWALASDDWNAFGHARRVRSEGPQHTVTISKPFWIGACEVTRGQFRAFVTETGFRTEADVEGGFAFKDGSFTQDPKVNWATNPGFDQNDEHPVVNVTWNDAKAFCQWLSRMETCEYDLPTEAQWEYACRAGTTGHWSVPGNDETLLGSYCWLGGRDGIGTKPVGQKRPNAFGLFDMHGNVFEWCEDYCETYELGHVTDPVGPPSASKRAVRGGGWGYALPENLYQAHPAIALVHCRSAFRADLPPDYRRCYAGFRVLADVSAGN